MSLSKEILKDPTSFESRIRKKDPNFSIKEFLTRKRELSDVTIELDLVRNSINTISKKIGQKGMKESESFRVNELKKKRIDLEALHGQLSKKCNEILLSIPNPPDDDLTLSFDPKDNSIIYQSGCQPSFDFIPKNHMELNNGLQLFDFPKGAKISGTSWVVYSDVGARLEWALINFMLNIHINNGFVLHFTPYLVKKEIMIGSGQLPKFEGQAYKLKDDNLYLIPTSEVSLNGLHYNEIFNKNELPKLYVSYSPCFRREAGGSGSSQRGLLRIHQFNKVELFAITCPEDSEEIFKKIELSAEEILKKLKIHYRKSLLVTGETSHAASRTIDLEVWLPGQKEYSEVSSISNCRDFQANRSMIRFKDGKKNKLAHTLNGSGLATPRLMAAILENNQNKDGSINVPVALKPYFNEEVLCPT